MVKLYDSGIQKAQALVYIFISLIFFSNFRTIAALTTISSFNGENRQRTSNTWRFEQVRVLPNGL